jgi:hypothetical protein
LEDEGTTILIDPGTHDEAVQCAIALRVAARMFDKYAKGQYGIKPWEDKSRTEHDRQAWVESEPKSRKK